MPSVKWRSRSTADDRSIVFELVEFPDRIAERLLTWHGPAILSTLPRRAVSPACLLLTAAGIPMPIARTCPNCHVLQAIPDEPAGQTVRCPSCQAEYPAESALPASAPPKRRDQRLAAGLILAAAVLLAIGLSGYLIYRPTPTDFTEPNGIFSARFPNRPTAETVSQANPLMLRWGEQKYRANVWRKEYSVAILDGLNAGDELYGPATRDKHINGVLAITLTNANGEQLLERQTTHEDHPAREVVFAGRDGRLTALRVVAGERYALRLEVSGPGTGTEAAAFLDQAGEFFGGVHVGAGFGLPVVDDPTPVSVADLVSAYMADADAADAKYKDRWLKVTGPIREVDKDGTEFLIEGGESLVVVKRAPPARMTVRLNPGKEATTTGRCRGLQEDTSRNRRVLLDEAIVARPPSPT